MTGEILRKFSGHEGPICSVAVSQDGKVLYTASGDRTVAVWDRERTERIGLLEGHQQSVWRVVIDANGRVLTSGQDRMIKLWDAATREERASLIAFRESA